MRRRRYVLIAVGGLLAVLGGTGPSSASAAHIGGSPVVSVEPLGDQALWSLDRDVSTSPLASPDADHATYDVTAISTDEAWAVGKRVPPGIYPDGWVRHWNGDRWAHVSSPALPSSELLGVTAVSEQDVWAVGDFAAKDGSGFGDVLVEHWDGNRWGRVFAPRPGGFSELNAVDGNDPDDIWGVGIGNGCLTEHWDGIRWRVVRDATPRGSSFCDLFGVKVLSPDNVYAVGVVDTTPYKPFVEHWDGTMWTRQSVVGAPRGTYFFSVDASSDGDVWAVGVTRHGDNSVPALAHLDGETWTHSVAAPPEHSSVWTRDIAVAGPSDVWIVGNQDGPTEPQTALAEHFDGKEWTVVPVPGRSKTLDDLGGVSALAPDDVFAGGAYAVHNKTRALQEHWDGAAWSIMH